MPIKTTTHREFLNWCEERAATIPPEEFQAFVRSILSPERELLFTIEEFPEFRGSIWTVGRRVLRWVEANLNDDGKLDPFVEVREKEAGVRRRWAPNTNRMGPTG